MSDIEFSSSRRRLLRLAGALTGTALLESQLGLLTRAKPAHAQSLPEDAPQETADINATKVDFNARAEAPIEQTPAESLTKSPVIEVIAPYKEPMLFTFSVRNPIFDGADYENLKKYVKPFEFSKIGQTTDAQLTQELGPNTKPILKGDYAIYSIPLPPTVSQELRRRDYEPSSRNLPPRENEIVTRNGTVFMERVVGFAEGSLKRVPEYFYASVLGHDPVEVTGGHKYWGNSFNRFYPDNGFVTITSQAPAGPDYNQINEYVSYDPRKIDGTMMTIEEFKAAYTIIHGDREFDYNPNNK